MRGWSKLADLAISDIAKVSGIAAEDIEKAGAAAKLADAALSASRAERTAAKGKGARAGSGMSALELSTATNELNIGGIFKGSQEADVKLRGKRTKLGVTLEALPGHEFEIPVLDNTGHAQRVTRLPDGSGIFEHSARGIAVENGARKLHKGINDEGVHFVKALAPDGVGIYGPETASEMYAKYGPGHVKGLPQLSWTRDVYAKPQTVHIAEDASMDNVVQVHRDLEVNRISVRVQDREHGLVEHWFGVDGKTRIAPSFHVAPLEDVNTRW